MHDCTCASRRAETHLCPHHFPVPSLTQPFRLSSYCLWILMKWPNVLSPPQPTTSRSHSLFHLVSFLSSLITPLCLASMSNHAANSEPALLSAPSFLPPNVFTLFVLTPPPHFFLSLTLYRLRAPLKRSCGERPRRRQTGCSAHQVDSHATLRLWLAADLHRHGQ